MTNHSFELSLPYRREQVRYIQSSEEDLEVLDFYILYTIYKHRDFKDEELIQFLLDSFQLQSKFENYIIERLSKLRLKEYISYDEDLKTLLIGNITLHPLIIKHFDNNIPKGTKKDLKQNDIFFYTSLIDKSSFWCPLEHKSEIDDIKIPFPFIASDNLKKEQYDEIIEQSYIDKDKELYESKILESKISWLNQKVDFDLELSSPNNILLVANTKLAKSIFEKIVENNDEYSRCLKEKINSQLYNIDIIDSIKNLKFVALKSTKEIEQNLAYNFKDKLNIIKKCIDDIKNFFPNENYIFYEDKWFEVNKTILCLKLKEKDAIINPEKTIIILSMLSNEEKNKIYNQFYNKFIQICKLDNIDTLNEMVEKIEKIKDKKLILYMKEKIYEQINIFDFSTLKHIISIKDKSLFSKEEFLKSINCKSYFENFDYIDFDSLLFKEINNELLKKYNNDQTVKDLIFKNIVQIERFSETTRFKNLLKMFNFNFNEIFF